LEGLFLGFKTAFKENDAERQLLEGEQGGRVLDEYLTRFLQLRQTSLRLIRVRRIGIFFYDLPIKFRSVRLVELLLFQLRGIA
jgi:hypothetical protein